MLIDNGQLVWELPPKPEQMSFKQTYEKKSSINNFSPHGGRREGAGRPAGMPNKAKIEQGARLAKSYSDIAFNILVDVAIKGTSDSAQIAAANLILDRGYGKPKSDGVVWLSCQLQ